ncbi:hypothetical protein BDA96_07G015100 [Sorghum bicolor]|nr:hypothetical protein BDA96_07G015100 [Sorghum bicolor]
MWYKYLTGFCTQIVSRHGMSARIKRINRRLAKISDSQKEYNIVYKPLAQVISSTSGTSSWSDDPVAPIDENVKLLGEMLFHEDPQLMFFFITGESGIGKNTVVINMLDSDKMPTELKIVLFRVPPGATVDLVLMEIYKRAAGDIYFTEEGQIELSDPKADDIDHDYVDISEKIRRVLVGNRYLLILGGTYSKTMFNCVRASLPDSNNGSRVLLILDNEDEQVAWHAYSMIQGGINGIFMRRLDEKGSGLLFRSRAFSKVDISDYGDMMTTNNMYNEIVYDITGGYPLAIVVLAGLLRFKERPGQWEAVLQLLRPTTGPRRMEEASLATIVQGGNNSCEAGNQQQQIIDQANNNNLVSLSSSSTTSRTTTAIERVFWASFEDLPNDIKSCFLYLAAFPKNTDFFANGVVRMWIAEGFIKPQKASKTMEELGYDYVKELVLRCLVQVRSVRDNFDDIFDTRLRIHPRLNELLYSEAREAGFMEAHDMSVIRHVFVPPSVRRLSYMGISDRYTTAPFTKRQFPKLRTFTCWYTTAQNQEEEEPTTVCHDDIKFLCGSKLIRVIQTGPLRLKELPDKIGDMIHLRYLAVNSKYLKEIPSSIKRLLNLQTLDIRCTQVDKIHPGFWKIRTLRHVLADKLMLPENNIVEDEELGELQTLQGVKPATAAAAGGGGRREGEWTQHNCPLHKMTKLRSLYLHGILRDKHGAALESALTKMHLLGRLELQGDVPSCVFTAWSLRCLQVLRLFGTVEWPEVGWDASKVRPNLVMLQLRPTNKVPQHMQVEIDRIHKRNQDLTLAVISTTATQGDDFKEILIE